MDGFRHIDIFMLSHNERAGRAFMADIVIFIIDPATGGRITQAQYQARYPWTNPRTWTYDPPSNLWTDHTRDYGNDYREDSRDRGRRR